MKKFIFMSISVIMILIGIFSYSNLAQDEISSPGNHIKDSQLITTENFLILDIDNVVLAEFKNTGSMLPLLNEYSTGIEIVPESENQVGIGDIIVYEKNGEQIIHRVKYINDGNSGKTFVVKGDNDGFEEEVKFYQVEYLLVGILY